VDGPAHSAPLTWRREFEAARKRKLQAVQAMLSRTLKPLRARVAEQRLPAAPMPPEIAPLGTEEHPPVSQPESGPQPSAEPAPEAWAAARLEPLPPAQQARWQPASLPPAEVQWQDGQERRAEVVAC
jgi:hypothetical protein